MIAFQFRLSIALPRRLIVTLFTCLALLCASRPSSAEVADWDQVIAAAKAEGGVVLYTALLGVPSTKAIAKAFEAKYGIPVQVLEARASCANASAPNKPPGVISATCCSIRKTRR